MTDDVIDWLAEEGFLRYERDPNHQHGFYWKVRLTLNGLTILGYMPTALQQAEQKEPLIQKVKTAISSATSSAGKEARTLVVSEIFKLAKGYLPGSIVPAVTV